MPKHEIHHNPGQPISDEIRELIDRYFDENLKHKLERLGGKIVISITSPKWSPKNDDNNFNFSICLHSLEINKDSFDNRKDLLDKLTVKQLKRICKEFGIPVSSNARSEEIKQEILKSLQAPEYWDKISK